MLVFVCSHHLLYDLLDILIGGLNCTVHLGPIGRRVVMFNLESLTQGLHHIIVQVSTVVGDNLAGNTISTDDVVLDELNHHLLGYIGIGSSFDPFGKVIDRYQNETMTVRSLWFNSSNHIDAPHRERPRGGNNIEGMRRHMDPISINLTFVTFPGILVAIALHGHPIVASP